MLSCPRSSAVVQGRGDDQRVSVWVVHTGKALAQFREIKHVHARTRCHENEEPTLSRQDALALFTIRQLHQDLPVAAIQKIETLHRLPPDENHASLSHMA